MEAGFTHPALHAAGNWRINSDLTDPVQTDPIMENWGAHHMYYQLTYHLVLRKDRHNMYTPMPRKRRGEHGWASLLADVLGKSVPSGEDCILRLSMEVRGTSMGYFPVCLCNAGWCSWFHSGCPRVPLCADIPDKTFQTFQTIQTRHSWRS